MDNNCLNCKYANWKKTANGRLHPDKQGRCAFNYVPPPLPKAFNWYGYRHQLPISGGYIERNKPQVDCPTFEAI